MLSPLLFNVYTNDQPLPADTHSFIYADDLCLTTQHKTFEQVENTLDSGINELGAYYKEPRANPAKTQLTAFHLKNRQADRKLNVTWNCTKLDHTHSPVYLGITLDRSITYRNHCPKTRAKFSSRNNVRRKLHDTNWGACPHTMKTTATAICLSVAEYSSTCHERPLPVRGKSGPSWQVALRGRERKFMTSSQKHKYILHKILQPK